MGDECEPDRRLRRRERLTLARDFEEIFRMRGRPREDGSSFMPAPMNGDIIVWGSSWVDEQGPRGPKSVQTTDP